MTDRLAELEAENAALREALGVSFDCDPVKSRGMTKTMRKMFGMLLTQDLCTRESLHHCTRGVVEPRSVEVSLSRLRRFLRKSFGVEIVLHREQGWSLRPEDKQLLRKELGIKDGQNSIAESGALGNVFPDGASRS